MEHEFKWRRVDLEEDLKCLWDWCSAEHYLDGWKINTNRISKDDYLLEIGKDLGPISVPHRHRHSGKL
ncbi:MAG: hypothetical protein GX335_02945 [Firmicutes bacterium]|nr:hypothetical protein [Bacillota bacterium]